MIIVFTFVFGLFKADHALEIFHIKMGPYVFFQTTLFMELPIAINAVENQYFLLFFNQSHFCLFFNFNQFSSNWVFNQFVNFFFNWNLDKCLIQLIFWLCFTFLCLFEFLTFSMKGFHMYFLINVILKIFATFFTPTTVTFAESCVTLLMLHQFPSTWKFEGTKVAVKRFWMMN